MLGKEELQNLIDKTDKTPGDMRRIAEAYLWGDVLKDKVAAEAWFSKVIEGGDNSDSMAAMILLAREIYGIINPVSEEDFLAMNNELEKSLGKEKENLKNMIEEAYKTKLRCKYNGKMV